MKRNISLIAALAGLALVFGAALSAKAAQTIQVQIAPYYTEIECMSVYNPAVEYPVMTYKDVAYIPLTNSLCARLGIAVGFTHRDGFYATKYNDAAFFAPTTDSPPFGNSGTHFYGTNYTAVLPDYPVYLNGIHYNNYKEEYPFFNYNGVTYLPLTYRFAYEELGLDVRFSAEGLFVNRMEYRTSSAERVLAEDGTNFIIEHRTERTEKISETGLPIYSHVSWWDVYRLGYNRDFDHLTYYGSYTSLSELPGMQYPVLRRDGENENIYTTVSEDGKRVLYYKGEQIDTLDVCVDYFGREYIFDDTVFIYVNVYTNSIPAPYTSHEEFIYVKDSYGTRKLSWDSRNNLERVIPDGIGGYYLCSDSYSPLYSSRMSTPFSSVCHYRADGSFAEVTIPELNSVMGYTVFGGRLYVKGMYYGADKNASPSYLPISAVNSGYYLVDPKDDSSVKLYPYVEGSIFISDKGGFYCIYNGGASPRLVNFVTGRVLEVE